MKEMINFRIVKLREFYVGSCGQKVDHCVKPRNRSVT